MSSKPNGKLYDDILPNRAKEVKIDGVKIAAGRRTFIASIGEADISAWLFEVVKDGAKIVAIAVFRKYVWPKIRANSKVTGLRIGNKRVSKKMSAIEKAFLDEIDRLEKEDKKEKD